MSAFHAFCSEWSYSFSSVSQATHFWRYCGPLLHEFHNQHSFHIPENSCHSSAFWEADVCLKIFGLFIVWMCVHPLLWLLFLVSTFTNETQVSSPVTCTMWLRNSSPSLWYRSGKDKRRTREHFRIPSCAELMVAYPNCDNVVENSAWNLWKFTWKFWNCEAPSSRNFLVNILNKIITRYRCPTTSLFIVNICSHIFGHSTSLSYSFGSKPRIIHDRFPQHSCF
jgi:hypothetical protein